MPPPPSPRDSLERADLSPRASKHTYVSASTVCPNLTISLPVLRRYFEFFLLEYKAVPINACIFAALCLSCIVQCMISSMRKVNSLSRDGQDSLEVLWNYCMAISFLCILGIL